MTEWRRRAEPDRRGSPAGAGVEGAGLRRIWAAETGANERTGTRRRDVLGAKTNVAFGSTHETSVMLRWGRRLGIYSGPNVQAFGTEEYASRVEPSTCMPSWGIGTLRGCFALQVSELSWTSGHAASMHGVASECSYSTRKVAHAGDGGGQRGKVDWLMQSQACCYH
jgi:hypothetical protein